MNCKKMIPLAMAAVLTGCSTIQQQNETAFIAATFNVRYDTDKSPNTWAERCPRCKEIISKNHFDIFGLQEPLAHQVDTLFKDSEFDVIGGGREDFKRAGEFSCIAYRRDRFECLKSGTFGLSEKPDQPGFRSWNSACPRIATWGLFRDRKTGKEFVYYNTHLDHRSESARCKGIEMLVAHAKKHAAGKPVMISGDFNSYPGSQTYKTAQSLLNDSKLVSETPHTGPEYTFHGWGKIKKLKRPQYPPIDFIFVSPEFRVLSHKTDDSLVNRQYASDHFPVVVKMILK